MNGWKSARIFIASLGLAGSAGTSAGALGPTSRGTVSISITIPPHVQVSAVREAEDRSSQGNRNALCIATNGVHDYHVALFDARNSSPLASSFSPQSAFARAAAERAVCAGRGASDETSSIDLGNRIARSGGPPGAPVTLIIIPD